MDSFNILKFILGMKLGHIILVIGGIVLAGSIIKNIFSGSFNIFKFASGFNPFLGGIQGKLIWLAIWCFIFFTAYQFIMRPTYSYNTDYRNHIRDNQDVFIDQKVGAGCIPTKILWGLIQFGCKSDPMTKTVTYDCQKCQEVKK